MPATPHIEKHFTATEAVRDVVIGMSDGLTVPFALAAGLSAAVSSTSVIVTAGLAEVAAGAIAMGLGGFLAARTDAEHYNSEVSRESYEIDHLREREVQEVAEILKGYGLEGQPLNAVVGAITADRAHWIDFMMRFELGTREAGSASRFDQRPDDRGSLYCRRSRPPSALHHDGEYRDGAQDLGDDDGNGVARIRGRQGTFHRSEPGALRTSNAGCRRLGRGRSLGLAHAFS